MQARSRTLFRVAVGCALVVAVTGRGGPSASAVPIAYESSTYTLMQMNLCLSGFAGCYGKVAYPAGLEEAVARIRHVRPDAVTLNETCRADVAQIARRTGYHVRFSTVTVAGEPLRCTRPGARGFFGDAVLTKAVIASADSHDFNAQVGIEWRRWLCVRTDVDVCTAHLATEAGANAAQCAELTTILARRAATHTVIFGGDVNNRSRACAPVRAWTRSDGTADQAPGLQAIYGSGALDSPMAQVTPAAHTDHDVLQVRARYRVTRKRPITPGWLEKPTK